MQELFNLGIQESDIKAMLEINNDIKDLSSQEIYEKEIILTNVNCTKNQMKNIISSNALFLTRTNEEIIQLINCLKKYRFDTLNILFDSNPYILNLDDFEIENYISTFYSDVF